MVWAMPSMDVPLSREDVTSFLSSYRVYCSSGDVSAESLQVYVEDFLNDRYGYSDKFVVRYVERSEDSLDVYLSHLRDIIIGLDYAVLSGFDASFAVLDTLNCFYICNYPADLMASDSTLDDIDNQSVGLFSSGNIYILFRGTKTTYVAYEDVVVHELAHSVDFAGYLEGGSRGYTPRLSAILSDSFSSPSVKQFKAIEYLTSKGVFGFPTSYSQTNEYEYLAESVAEYILPSGILNKSGSRFRSSLESTYRWVDALLNTESTKVVSMTKSLKS